MLAHIYNPGTQRTEAGDTHPRTESELEDNLNHTRLCLKKIKMRTGDTSW